MLDQSPATIRVDLHGPLEGRHVLVDFRRVDFLALRLGRGPRRETWEQHRERIMARGQAKYVVDDLFGLNSSGLVRVRDQTNGTRLQVAGTAIKLTGGDLKCNLDIDVETSRPVVQIRGRDQDGNSVNIRAGG